MPADNTLATFGTHVLFELDGPRVRARINPYAPPPAAPATERDYPYHHLTAPLRERGLE